MCFDFPHVSENLLGVDFINFWVQFLIVNLWKDVMLLCPCNICHLFCCSQVMPNFVWCCFTALLDIMFTNKKDRFTDYDRDRKIMFEPIHDIWHITRMRCFSGRMAFDKWCKKLVHKYSAEWTITGKYDKLQSYKGQNQSFEVRSVKIRIRIMVQSLG